MFLYNKSAHTMMSFVPVISNRPDTHATYISPSTVFVNGIKRMFTVLAGVVV